METEHPAEGKTCGSCAWLGFNDREAAARHDTGVCRRFPPSPIGGGPASDRLLILCRSTPACGEWEELRALMRRIEKRKEEVELLRTLVRHEESHRNQDAAFAPCERTLCYALCESLTADIARLTHEYQGLLFKLEREGEVKHGA
jgi:hypothetical protein